MRRLLVLVIALSGGCTRTPPGPNYDDRDEAAMTRVEEAARNGVKVYWVNPPRKAPAPEGR